SCYPLLSFSSALPPPLLPPFPSPPLFRLPPLCRGRYFSPPPASPRDSKPRGPVAGDGDRDPAAGEVSDHPGVPVPHVRGVGRAHAALPAGRAGAASGATPARAAPRMPVPTARARRPTHCHHGVAQV